MSAAIEARGSRTDRGQAAVALAAIVWSTAGVLQRQLSVGVATQVAGRALFAAVAVAAYVAVAERGRVRAACRSVGGAGVGFAASVAVSSGAFIVSLNHASVAQVLFIQSIAPVLAALLGRALLGESLSGRTAMAMAVAVLGVGVMVGSPGGGSALGDGLSVLMALGFAVAIVIARHRRDVSMAPATGLAQWRDRGRGRRPPGPRPSGAAARQSRREESKPSTLPADQPRAAPRPSHVNPRRARRCAPRGRWPGFRFILGPCRWLILVYVHIGDSGVRLPLAKYASAPSALRHSARHSRLLPRTSSSERR